MDLKPLTLSAYYTGRRKLIGFVLVAFAVWCVVTTLVMAVSQVLGLLWVFGSIFESAVYFSRKPQNSLLFHASLEDCLRANEIAMSHPFVEAFLDVIDEQKRPLTNHEFTEILRATA